MARKAKAAKKATRKSSRSIGRGSQEEQVRLRAYELYVARGAIPGRELEDWLRAERELQQGK